MTLDYYYGDQAEQFSFYRIPKVLFTDSRFKDISAEAKILYGLLLDRMSLSAKNGWLDQEGRVYIVYTATRSPRRIRTSSLLMKRSVSMCR